MMDNKEQFLLQKQQVAEAALDYIEHPMVLGIGSGTTVFELIKRLPQRKQYLKTVVAASRASVERLMQCGITAVRSGDVEIIDLYLDGADEIDEHLCMIKGGGAALTGEKIMASMAARFICLVDRSKLCVCLGRSPLPIEIIPGALPLVRKRLLAWGASKIVVRDTMTEYGNLLLMVSGIDFVTHSPLFWERYLNQLPGVVTNGIFAQRPADQMLVATGNEVRCYDQFSAC